MADGTGVGRALGGLLSGELVVMHGLLYVAASAVGVDPDSKRLAEIVHTRPQTMGKSVTFAQAEAETLPFPGSFFECAIFAWSL